ncbi:MAG: CPBP family intramembrane metalloprotease [Ignavibacteriaceae bacterium]|nr:CPBP family intramembrane metalloprotease [Ignavibacteriaceae bacterium]
MNLLTVDLKNLWKIVKQLDRKVLIIFLSVALLQTISYYYSSRRFFRNNFFEQLQSENNVYLYEYLYWFISDFVTLFVLPLFIIKFFLKEKLTSYGLTVGDYKTGLKYSIIFLAVMIPIIWFVSANREFAETYPQINDVKFSWSIFLVFEMGVLIYLTAWEFIWRGFMLFGLEEKFGYYTVLIQMIPFLILHNGKPAAETFGAIIAGLALGILALKTRSVLYCIIAHAGVMFSIELISIYRFRADVYGIGLNSLIKIFKIII